MRWRTAPVARLPAAFWSSSTRSSGFAAARGGLLLRLGLLLELLEVLLDVVLLQAHALAEAAAAAHRPTVHLDDGAVGKLTWQMQFSAPAEHYDRFMGRYVPTLAVALADAADVASGMRVLDVGCGPGGLTAELAARVGADHVAAIDPAEQFAEACRARNPGADVRVGVAEQLPWGDGEFDAALASLVVAFMRDARAGVASRWRA